MNNISVFIRIAVTVLGVIAPLIAVPWMLQSSTGAVGPLILLLGAASAITALLNPKVGLYLAAFQVIYLDYFKKLAVYYGEVSQLTIIQVLVVTLCTMICVYLGLIVRAAVGKTHLGRNDYLLFTGIAVFALIAFVVTFAEMRSVAAAGQVAVNISIYAGLLVAMPRLLEGEADLIRFFRFFILCLIPWAFMGLKQYFFGFSQMEWFYAETFLSQTASWQFFADIAIYGFPRTIGFGSGSVNYGAIGLLIPVSLWLCVNDRSQRKLWAFCTICLTVGIVFSLQRSSMLLPFIGIAFFLFTKTWQRLASAYFLTFSVLFVAIAYSDFILDRITDINSFIASDGKWAGSVLRVATFSERLMGWERLKEASTYSLLGKFGEGQLGTYQGGGKEGYHDVVNVILDTFGVVGLVIALGISAYFAYRVYKVIFSIQDPVRQSFARILMAAIVPIFVSGMLAGANFHTNPFNFILWMHIGAIFCLVRYDRTLLPGTENLDNFDLEGSLYTPEIPDSDLHPSGKRPITSFT